MGKGVPDPPRVRGLLSPILVRILVRDWRARERQSVRVQLGILAASVGIVANFVLAILKFAAGFLIASLSLIADAIDSLADVFQALITLIGFKVAGKAPDHGHPYGHERAEEIAAMVVATLLAVAGLQFGVYAVRRLLGPPETAFSLFALAVAFVSLVAKLGLSRFSFNFARYIESRALRGNAWNYLTDMLSSALTIVAVGGRYYGIYWLDPVIALGITVIILHVGFRLFREASDHLLGKGGTAQEVDEIHKLACGTSGVLGCSNIEVHKYGRKRLVSLRIQVSDQLTLADAHEIADRVERQVRAAHADWDPVVHVDPIKAHVPRGGHTPDALVE